MKIYLQKIAKLLPTFFLLIASQASLAQDQEYTNAASDSQAYNNNSAAINAIGTSAANEQKAALAQQNATTKQATAAADAQPCADAEAAVEGSDACKLDDANSQLSIAAVLAHALLAKEASEPVAACNGIASYATVANGALALYQASCVQKISSCLTACKSAVSADTQAAAASAAAGVPYSSNLKVDEANLTKCQTYEKGVPNQTAAITALVAANTNGTAACNAYKAQIAAEKSQFCTLYPNSPTCALMANEADCASGASTSPQCVCIRAGTCTTVQNPTTTGSPAASNGSGSGSNPNAAASMAAAAAAAGMPLDGTNPLTVTPPKAGTGLAGAQNGMGGGGGGMGTGAAAGAAKKPGAVAAKDPKALYAGYITNNGTGTLGGSGASGYNNADPNKRAVFGGKLGSGTMDLNGAKPDYNPARKPSSFTTGPDGLTGPNGNLFGKVKNQFADQVSQGNHFIGMP